MTLDACHELMCKKLQELVIGEIVDIQIVSYMTYLNFVYYFFSLNLVNSVGETYKYKGIIEKSVRAMRKPKLVDLFPIFNMVDPYGIRRISTTCVKKVDPYH